jgi:membrane-bound inhibitor of C-type lysozyme
MKHLAIAIAVGFWLCGPAQAGVSAALTLTIDGNAEQRQVTYDCTGEGDTALAVTYINAAPNFLAVLPVRGEDMIFVSVIAASGVKYEAGAFVWWSKGAEATLHDVTEGLDAAPVLTCAERIETP